jgi:glycosyltransferase involved in cell wall biosynthesis
MDGEREDGRAKPQHGMDWYRLLMPYFGVDGHEITAVSRSEFDINPLDADVYVINRSRELFRAERVKKEGKKLIIDIDDYWVLPTWHKLHLKNLEHELEYGLKHGAPEQLITERRKLIAIERNAASNTIASMRLADAVTTTNEQLAERCLKYNKNVHIVRNSIHPQFSQYSLKKQRSNRLRFGWLGGSFHLRDVALMHDGIMKLYRDSAEQGKFQFVASYNSTFEFMEIEKVFTSNYQYISPQYRELLKANKRVAEHMGLQETYRRLWSTPFVYEFPYFYENIHVGLVPLVHGEFNSCKSELKLVEAGMTGTAAIVSDVLPYSKWLKHGKNCLTTEGVNNWYSAFKMCLNNPSLVEDIRDGLSETVDKHFNNADQAKVIENIIESWK